MMNLFNIKKKFTMFEFKTAALAVNRTTRDEQALWMLQLNHPT